MKLTSPRAQSAFGFLASAIVRRWMGTVECKSAYYDPSVDPAHPDYDGEKIYIFWHEYILGPLAFRGHCNMAMLISHHRDAQVLGRAAHHLGFEVVQGSTSRGGTAALRELVRRSGRMNLTITPDGPRGPRRRLAQGPIYLSSRLGLPLVAMGVGFDRPWRLRSWDRFAIPRPFSRGRAILSPAVQIPPDLDRDGVEHYRVQIERMLNRLTKEAEAWAESGRRRADESPVHHRFEPPWTPTGRNPTAMCVPPPLVGPV